MPTEFSGVENRISEARELHQELHRTARQAVAEWQNQAKRLTTTVNALNEANEALDTKVNTALALSMLAATVSIIALKGR